LQTWSLDPRHLGGSVGGILSDQLRAPPDHVQRRAYCVRDGGRNLRGGLAQLLLIKRIQKLEQ
jgi:hypothetical protein